jgi:hypothetical protein
MGYIHGLSGGFTLDPPLTYKAFRDSRYYPDGPMGGAVDTLLHFEAEERQDETDNGLVFTISAPSIGVVEDGVKIYSLDAQLDEIFDCIPEGTEVGGYIEAQGEDGESWFRIYPLAQASNGRRWRKIYARLVWPLERDGIAPDETRELSRG